ncbi:fragment of glycogen synthase (part 2/2) [Candidatus Desulfosporosinus infrequens]|uniref:Fragment of glycogen synthase (Part 2/2) n=1 Tax=Candidatus Desulfosporosinus infrequens TaxID=2043169 RepID=A0A2U3KIT8_9FIRM|nr:fragment of glycogen synthase (part 2/2) [Candidatus Desulfosporosinus infrequens]
MLFAIQNALKIYQEDKLVWSNICQNALASDFGWDRSANAYIEIYESLL